MEEMKLLRVLILGLMFVTLPFFQQKSYGFVKGDDNSQSYAGFIDKVQAYQSSVKLVREIKEPDKGNHWTVVSVDTSTFNVYHYLSFFDQCKPAEGYRFGLYSAYRGSGGKPVLFAKADTFNEEAYYKKMIIRNTQIWDSLISKNIIKDKSKGLSEERINQRIKLREDLKKESNTKERIMARYAVDSLHRAFNYLIPVDSDMGYLQYLFFNVIGEQFALYWHSNYGYKKIISSKESVEYYLNYYKDNSDFSCELGKLENLLKTDVSPKTILNPDDCFISWYEIETHNGVFKRSYTIQRHPPYLIKKISSERVVGIAPNFFY